MLWSKKNLISACSSFYQESLVYANRSLEVVPGEKVLRDNKEYRDQQNRLKEIDHQLKSLERNSVSLLFYLSFFFFPVWKLWSLSYLTPLQQNPILKPFVNSWKSSWRNIHAKSQTWLIWELFFICNACFYLIVSVRVEKNYSALLPGGGDTVYKQTRTNTSLKHFGGDCIIQYLLEDQVWWKYCVI